MGDKPGVGGLRLLVPRVPCYLVLNETKGCGRDRGVGKAWVFWISPPPVKPAGP